MTITSLLAAAAAPSANAAFFWNTVPLVLVFVIFYFLLIRPQSKRMKEHQAQIGAVKKGDRVVTGGGLIGKVTKVTDTEVEVELGQTLSRGARRSMLEASLTATSSIHLQDAAITAVPMDRPIGSPRVRANFGEKLERLSFLNSR